jgi:hypothetical protein
MITVHRISPRADDERLRTGKPHPTKVGPSPPDTKPIREPPRAHPGTTDSLNPGHPAAHTGSHRPASRSTPPRPTGTTPVHRLPTTHRATTTYQQTRKRPRPGVNHQVKALIVGAPPGTRTPNPRIKSPLLCQLS